MSHATVKKKPQKLRAESDTPTKQSLTAPWEILCCSTTLNRHFDRAHAPAWVRSLRRSAALGAKRPGWGSHAGAWEPSDLQRNHTSRAPAANAGACQQSQKLHAEGGIPTTAERSPHRSQAWEVN